MTKAGVFVVGSLHYDIVVDAPHLPARDETVIGGPMRFVCGGKGGNQAVAASHHGADVAFGGMVGEDRFGDALASHLRDAGVDIAQVRSTRDAASGASVAVVEDGGDYGAVVASGANLLIDPDQIVMPEHAAWLVLQNEIPEPVNLEMARRARTAGMKVILNAAPWRPRSIELRDMIDVLVVNRVEAEGLCGQSINSKDAALSAVGECDLCIPLVVVTLGADGLAYRLYGHRPQHLEGFDVETVSSHGAGDAFVGALCSALVRSEAFAEALLYASAAAALHVSTTLEERMSIGRERTAAFLASASRGR